jgi:hypothetical protein
MQATDRLGEALLQRARNAIASALERPVLPEAAHEAMQVPGASFVTLTIDSGLRGCIGSLEAFRSLEADVRANARAAAFRDPRFEPLSADEFARVRVEVSVLTPAEPLAVRDEREALALVRPYEDGIVLGFGGRSATFLPQVWEQLPEPREFLRALRRKAGLPADFWAPGLTLSRYGVSKWREVNR